MTTTKERKITFHALMQRPYGTEDDQPFTDIEQIIKYIIRQKKLDRAFDLKEGKVCFLQDATFEYNGGEVLISGYIKSARTSFRPNLFDKTTGDERKSPKKITEGDIEKNHFIIKISSIDTYLLFEVNGNGLTVGQFLDYLRWLNKKHLIHLDKPRNYSVFEVRIGREDFLNAVKELERARVAEVYFDKALLGSEALKFSNRTASLKREIMLTATAEKGESIKETCVDLFNTFKKENSVRKVRVYGTDATGNPTILDTSFIEKTDYINAPLNMETGEVISVELLNSMRALSQNI